MRLVKRHALPILTIGLYFAVFLYDQNLFKLAVSNTALNLKETTQILPAAFILTGLLNI